MTLSFKEQNNKHLTFFVDLIWQSILEGNAVLDTKLEGTRLECFYNYYKEYFVKYGVNWDSSPVNMGMKNHTIRNNSKGIYKVGSKLHPVVNNRTKKRFQFAPTLRCTALQTVEFENDIVFVEGKELSYSITKLLARNDGFNSVENMFSWFRNTKDKLTIVHWTENIY